MYDEKMTERLESCGRGGQWYSIYKFLDTDDIPDRLNISELEPNQSPLQLSNSLAKHFVQITNQAKSLSPPDIPKSVKGSGLIPQLDASNVEKFIKNFKKCASRVNGDIPRELVNPCAASLSKVLTHSNLQCLLPH